MWVPTLKASFVIDSLINALKTPPKPKTICDLEMSNLLIKGIEAFNEKAKEFTAKYAAGK